PIAEEDADAIVDELAVRDGHRPDQLRERELRAGQEHPTVAALDDHVVERGVSAALRATKGDPIRASAIAYRGVRDLGAGVLDLDPGSRTLERVTIEPRVPAVADEEADHGGDAFNDEVPDEYVGKNRCQKCEIPDGGGRRRGAEGDEEHERALDEGLVAPCTFER